MGVHCGGLGEAMYLAQHEEGATMPDAVEFNSDDSHSVRLMKELILEMTSFDANDRPTSSNVLHEVSSMFRRLNKSTVCACVNLSQ